MPCCCVRNCSNRSEKGFRLFHLPKGKANEDRRNLWVQNIGRTCLPNNPFVCEIHFTEDQFERNRADGRILLKWNAVPTLFILPLKTEKRSKGIISPNETEEEDNDLEEIQETTEAVGSEAEELESQPKKLKLIQEETFTTNDNPEEEFVQGTKTRRKKTVCIKRKQKTKSKKIKKMPKGTASAANKISQDNEEKKDLENRLKEAENRINELESHIFVYQNILEHLFNSDQIAYLMSEPVKGFKWSDETIKNALILYESCGRIGYEKLRKHNFPFPCAHTLEVVLNKL